jgi:branched-chain amino acid transport system ATP-binding protein
MLEIKGVWVKYGPIAAVRDLSMTIGKGDFVTVLGSNGAGKSSTINAISGMVSVCEGNICYKGDNITGRKPGKIAALGIIQIPEGRKLFPLLTVEENLNVGAYLCKDKIRVRKEKEKSLEFFPILKEKLHEKARSLSGGQQQMVAIARGLMACPEILMFDEPSLGLSPIIRQQLAQKITEIHRDGTTIILVEQNARLGLMIASYGYVLENGELSMQGPTGDLMRDENVKKAYLGV